MSDEEAALRKRFWHPRAGDTVLDIGSFEGSYTYPALEAGASVHAFDPHHRLPDHPGLTMCVGSVGEPYPPALLKQIERACPGMTPDGPWISVDEYVAQHDLRVDWMKVDVEGGELAVLRAAAVTLERDKPTLIVEDHSQVYDLPDSHHSDLVGLLRGHGYDVTGVELTGYALRPVHIIATHPERTDAP